MAARIEWTPVRIVGLVAVIVVTGLIVFVAVRISTGPPVYDPGDYSMSKLRQSLISSTSGAVDVGLRYPRVGNEAGGAVMLEMGDADAPTIAEAVAHASCRVWREMYFDPSFVWAGVVRERADVRLPEDPDLFDPYELTNPVDLRYLADEFAADRFEQGYLQWGPEALEARCGERTAD